MALTPLQSAVREFGTEISPFYDGLESWVTFFFSSRQWGVFHGEKGCYQVEVAIQGGPRPVSSLVSRVVRFVLLLVPMLFFSGLIRVIRLLSCRYVQVIDLSAHDEVLTCSLPVNEKADLIKGLCQMRLYAWLARPSSFSSLVAGSRDQADLHKRFCQEVFDLSQEGIEGFLKQLERCSLIKFPLGDLGWIDWETGIAFDPEFFAREVWQELGLKFAKGYMNLIRKRGLDSLGKILEPLRYLFARLPEDERWEVYQVMKEVTANEQELEILAKLLPAEDLTGWRAFMELASKLFGVPKGRELTYYMMLKHSSLISLRLVMQHELGHGPF